MQSLKNSKFTKGIIIINVKKPTKKALIIAAILYTIIISFILKGGISKSTIFPATFEDSNDDDVFAKEFCIIPIIIKPGAKKSI